MFETDAELRTLQKLLDSGFEKVGGRLAGFDQSQQMSAKQLAGFKGVRLVSVASVNSKEAASGGAKKCSLPSRKVLPCVGLQLGHGTSPQSSPSCCHHIL